MPIGNWNLEWLNHNSQRAYPLAADATATDTTNSFELPEDFIVDLYLQVPVSADIEPSRFFIKNIGSFQTGFSIVVGYQSSFLGPINIASASIARQAATPDSVFRLTGIGDFVDAIGFVVIGRLEAIDLQPTGFFTFALDDGRLEAEPIRPQLRGVSALIAVNGADRSNRLQEDIELIAGANMRITAIPAVGGSLPKIRFDAIEGEGLTEDCVCEDTGVGPEIRTINGIGPSLTGNVNISGSTCVSITSEANGITINDTCSEPCCGCEELEAVTTDLEALRTKARTLEVFVTNLEASVTQTDQVILGSRLTDKGCLGP
jgi:hypothetical protein